MILFQRIIPVVISAMYLDNFREVRDNSLSGVCRRFFRRRQCPRSEGQLERRERVGVRRSGSYIKSWRGHYPKSVLRWTLSQETLPRRLYRSFYRAVRYHLLYFSFVKKHPGGQCLCSSVFLISILNQTKGKFKQRTLEFYELNIWTFVIDQIFLNVSLKHQEKHLRNCALQISFVVREGRLEEAFYICRLLDNIGHEVHRVEFCVVHPDSCLLLNGCHVCVSCQQSRDSEYTFLILFQWNCETYAYGYHLQVVSFLFDYSSLIIKYFDQMYIGTCPPLMFHRVFHLYRISRLFFYLFFACEWFETLSLDANPVRVVATCWK